MNEKEQMIQEMIEELLGLLRDGESLTISRVGPPGEAVSVVGVVDSETKICVDGGLNPARLLASRI